MPVRASLFIRALQLERSRDEIFLRTEESHNETGPFLIGPFHPIKNEIPLPKERDRVQWLGSHPHRLTRVSWTSLNPENTRHPLFRVYQNLSSPLTDKFSLADLMSTHRDKRTYGSRCRLMYLSFAVAPVTHRMVCYFIPQPAGNFPYHVDSVDRWEGFDGFSSLRFCGLISGQNWCIFGFASFHNIKTSSSVSFRYNLRFYTYALKKNFPRNFLSLLLLLICII